MGWRLHATLPYLTYYNTSTTTIIEKLGVSATKQLYPFRLLKIAFKKSHTNVRISCINTLLNDALISVHFVEIYT